MNTSSVSDEFVAIIVSIIVLTIVAVIFGSKNTVGVIQSFSSVLGTFLKEAVSPISSTSNAAGTAANGLINGVVTP